MEFVVLVSVKSVLGVREEMCERVCAGQWEGVGEGCVRECKSERVSGSVSVHALGGCERMREWVYG